MENPIKKPLFLNPTENLPELLYTPSNTFMQGLYVDDSYETEDVLKSKTVLFSGHSELQQKIIEYQDSWKYLLHADHISLKLLSGLHAHTITFMGVGKIGDTVLILPSEAGGHHAAEKILSRLGYRLIEMVVDYENKCVDIPATIEIIKKHKPEFIFIDRSDGLNYEDFSELTKVSNTCNIFDASQYITHIISQQYKSPFEMGFQIMMSTLHKNFPGPQKALICSKDGDLYWQRILIGMNSFISSTHIANLVHAGLLITENLDYLTTYGILMLQNTKALEDGLQKYNVPIIKRNPNLPITQQIWIACKSSDEAYRHFRRFESFNILLNYRQLAYRLGYGLRLGTAAATLSGLRPKHCEQLAYFIQAIYFDHIPTGFHEDIQQFINSIWIEGDSLNVKLQ